MLGANPETFARIAANDLKDTEMHELIWGTLPAPDACERGGHAHVWSRCTDGARGWFRDNRCDCVRPIAGQELPTATA